MDNLGKNIRAYREQKRLSQKDLANLIEVKPAQLGRVENSKVEPTLKTILKISKALCVSLDDLIGAQTISLGEGKFKDKSLLDKVRLLDRLPEDEKDVVFKVIDLALLKAYLKEEVGKWE